MVSGLAVEFPVPHSNISHLVLSSLHCLSRTLPNPTWPHCLRFYRFLGQIRILTLHTHTVWLWVLLCMQSNQLDGKRCRSYPQSAALTWCNPLRSSCIRTLRVDFLAWRSCALGRLAKCLCGLECDVARLYCSLRSHEAGLVGSDYMVGASNRSNPDLCSCGLEDPCLVYLNPATLYLRHLFDQSWDGRTLH